jgi:hypothetical protein
MSQTSTIRLYLYCDEVLKASLEEDLVGGEVEYWDYLGLLIVPEERHKHLLYHLLNARCLNPDNDVWEKCDSPCRWHEDNNTEVHYTQLDDTRKFKVAQSWIELLIRNGKQEWGLVYFYILGLNRSKLDLERFGASREGRDMTIYNRFFRTAVQKSTKSFFHDYDRIVIANIFHDPGSGQEHAYFPWHTVWKLGREDPKLEFERQHVTFINSDHRKADGDPVHSHFIQFIDLILGCTFNILHYASKNKNKVSIALDAKPLLERIIRVPGNPNSEYNYRGRQSIEFFPLENLSAYEEDTVLHEMKRLNNFYTQRALRIERRLQPTLW